MDPLQGELGHSDVTRSLFDADTIAPQSTKHLREKKVNYEKAKTKQKKEHTQIYTKAKSSVENCQNSFSFNGTLLT